MTGLSSLPPTTVPPSGASIAERGGWSVDLSRPIARTVGRERLLARIERELDQARPVTLRGRRGVGKSRLLGELEARHVGPVELLSGTEVAAGAAMAPTVRDRPTGDASLLLLVDDAQQLPSREVARLHALQAQSWCRVVTTVATGAVTTAETGFGRWWATERWRSLEVAPLSRTATADLLSERLGGLPEPRLIHAVWQATGGHPVAIVEVVRDAHEVGSIAPGPDSWRLVSPLPGRRLAALVGDRLVGLSDAARHDLHVLALASPLPIRLAGRLLQPAAVQELEGRGLVRFRAGRAGRTLSIVDAVHAEVVRRGLDDAERRQVTGELADALDRCGLDARRHLDLARWRLQIGGWSADALVDAAGRARCQGNTGLAAALADAALRDGAGPAAARIAALSDVELRAGRPPSADHRGPAGQPGQQGGAASTPSDPLLDAQALAIGAGRWKDAVAALTGTQEHVADDHAAAATLSSGYAAVLEVLGGRPAGVAPMDADGSSLGGVASVLAAAARGDVEAAVAASGTVVGCAAGSDLLPIATDLVRGTLLLVATDEPLDERIDQAVVEVERALGQLSSATPWWYAVEGWLRWEAGDLLAARRRLTSAVLACADADPTRLRPLLLADLAVLSALSGSVIEAQWRLAQVGPDRTTNPAVALRCAVVDLLVVAARTGQAPCRDGLAALAAAAALDGRDRDATWVLHLGVRFAGPEHAGSAVQAVEDVRVVDEVVAAHLQAWDGRDPEALEAVARRFAAQGRRLLAAEAASQAAALGGGDRSAALAAALASGCTDAATPPVAKLDPVRISPRRRDAAVLAMQGCDDRRIAMELGLSVRTVENHLAKVYRQVGVNGRGELADLFEPTRAPFDRAVVGVG